MSKSEQIPDIPDNIDPSVYEFLAAVKRVVERLAGNQDPDEKAATYQDLIDMGIIDKDYVKI